MLLLFINAAAAVVGVGTWAEFQPCQIRVIQYLYGQKLSGLKLLCS